MTVLPGVGLGEWGTESAFVRALPSDFMTYMADVEKIWRIPFENDSVTLRRPGRMKVMGTGKVIVTVVGQTLEVMIVHIYRPDFRFWGLQQ